MNDSRDGMYRRWWKKGISWENFMTRKVNWSFFFFLAVEWRYRYLIYVVVVQVFYYLYWSSLFSKFFPLICVIKCFMNLMLLHWIFVKFYMEGQINRLGPYDYSLEIFSARRLWKCLFDWHCLLSYALTFGGW